MSNESISSKKKRNYLLLALLSCQLGLGQAQAEDESLMPEPLPGASPTQEATIETVPAAKAEQPKPENPKPENPKPENPAPLAPAPSSRTYAKQMDAVISQNGGYSKDHLFPCGDEDRFCFSGLLDLEARYYDHHGNPGIAFYGVDPNTGSLGGAGIRPVFGPSVRTFVGSINNANLFADLKVLPIAKIHTNLAYVNGAVVENSYDWEFEPDWGSVYRSGAALKVDELYLVLANADLLPIYFKVGRMYLDFGDYDPNAYGIDTIVPSLTQLVTQVRSGAGQVGLVLQNGLYGSLSVSYAQESYGIAQNPLPQVVDTRSNLSAHSRNFSGKLGFRNTIHDLEANVNVSFISDLRDADYLSSTVNWTNRYAGAPGVTSLIFLMRKKGGAAFHADFYLCPIGISFEGATSFGKMNTGSDLITNAWDSHIQTAGVEGKVDFKTLNHDSSLKLSYQLARHTQVISGNVFPGGLPLIHNMLPKYRWQGTYIINLIDHINAGLVWVYDHDFDAAHNGQDISSNMVVGRLDVEF